MAQANPPTSQPNRPADPAAMEPTIGPNPAVTGSATNISAIDRTSSTFDVSQPQGPQPTALPQTSSRRRTIQLPQFFSLLLHNRKSAFGLAVLAIITLAAIFAPLLTPYNPTDFADLPSQAPSAKHWFGTNQQGQDIFAQVIYGARISLMVGCCAALLATVISAFLGMLAAYVGGFVDEGINLLMNIFLVIPALPLLIVIASYVPSKGIVPMILIIGFITWAGEARVLRSQALALRSRDFILAAATAGESVWRIVFSEIMPNMTSRIAAGFVGSFVGAIIFEASLEFLGFGNVNNISWGITLFWAQNNAAMESGTWWHFTFPGLAIAITATSLIFVNYGIDEISNPRLQKVKMPKALKKAQQEPVAGKPVAARGA